MEYVGKKFTLVEFRLNAIDLSPVHNLFFPEFAESRVLDAQNFSLFLRLRFALVKHIYWSR